MSAARRITATYLAKHLSEVMDRARFEGEEFIVERKGKPVCRISPAEPRKLVKKGTVRDLDRIFEAVRPGKDFVKAIDDFRRKRRLKPPRDPWAS